jgi:hypothetical protein
MQGLDLEPPRRLHGAGEQAPGHLQGFSRGALAGEFGQFRAQRGIVQRHPAAEHAKHADRHVGGGRLGEGQAEDAGGRRPVEEEAHHAVGEHLGLARARIGRDPGRRARIGGPALRGLGEIVDDEGFAM